MARKPVDRTPKDGARHGTVPGYGVDGCRCVECCAAKTAARDEWIAAKLAAGEVEHGTVTGYMNYRCRCEKCSPVGRAYLRDLRTTRAERLGDVPHGTLNGYLGYDCRCDACGEASRVTDDSAAERGALMRERDRAVELTAGIVRGTSRRWTSEEDALLVSGVAARVAAAQLGRTVVAVRGRRSLLGITRCDVQGRCSGPGP